MTKVQPSHMALDLFRGAGGWSVAAERLGITDLGVEIMDEANATAEAAGFKTYGRDVWDVDPHYTDGQIASPPCQTFSKAGGGSGRKALDIVTEAIFNENWRTKAELQGLATETGDERTALVLMPMHFWWVGEPDWIVWEQVPTVLPVWEDCARVMRTYGYSVWTGKVHAEQYGVPQTRTRAVLIARKSGEAKPPVPTHSKYHSRSPERLDEGVQGWLSMAEGLGWGLTERPAYTIVAAGTSGGGPRPMDGGSGTRRQIAKARAEGKWIDKDAVVAEVEHRLNNQSGTEFDLTWPAWRPAPTVAGREIVTMPGANANRYNGSTKSRNDGIKVEAYEAGILQSFPADHPWQGTKTKQFEQIGNAVPPLMAEAILRAAIEEQ